MIRYASRRWDAIKEGVMEEVLVEKYTQLKGPRQVLFSTFGLRIIESSSNGFWGSGIEQHDILRRKRGRHPGHNNLGKILTRVRNSIVHKFKEEVPVLVLGDSMVKGVRYVFVD
jgi:ribA/ribD-fused uncharacterized protein